jgi:cbb3-type cytochrome oxidase subunit 3|tara:strand:+ start:167 stop:292 length:126 start_codon:yes stop_codon:yes gene_type:complete
MIEDLKSSAVAFVYAWAIILVPIFFVASIVSLVSPQAQETI